MACNLDDPEGCFKAADMAVATEFSIQEAAATIAASRGIILAIRGLALTIAATGENAP